MKFIHTSDLHLGKKIANLPMIEEQRHFLFDQLIPIIKERDPDALLVAGDIFDRANPSAEALSLFDDFMVALTRLPKPLEVFVSCGNHDGAERIAYGARILGKSGLHLSPIYEGVVTPYTMKDDYGEVDIYMLPFVRKATVQYYFPDEDIKTESDALAIAVRNMRINPHQRNLCVAHQFVSGASTSGSEETNIGGLDCVSADVFTGIDYVALGHIHKPQSINGCIRYYGSPIKYSLSEVDHKKSVTFVEIRQKGDVTITEIPVAPLNDWYDIRGSFDEIASQAYRSDHPEYEHGYLRITLTDENDVVDGYKALKGMYPHLVDLRYDNSRTRALGISLDSAENLSTDEEFISRLFAQQNGREMNEMEQQFISKILECAR